MSTAEDDRPRVLVSFDIDGTMEFGDPPGPVTADVARELFARGYIVGVASDGVTSRRRTRNIGISVPSVDG